MKEIEELIAKLRGEMASRMDDRDIVVILEVLQNAQERAGKYEKIQAAWFKGIEEKEQTIFFLRKCKEVIEDFEIPKEKPMV